MEGGRGTKVALVSGFGFVDSETGGRTEAGTDAGGGREKIGSEAGAGLEAGGGPVGGGPEVGGAMPAGQSLQSISSSKSSNALLFVRKLLVSTVLIKRSEWSVNTKRREEKRERVEANREQGSVESFRWP